MPQRPVRPVAAYVYERLMPDDLLHLRDWMKEVYDEDPQSAAYCDLSNAGHSVCGEPPFTDQDLYSMLDTLADIRRAPRTRPTDWDCILEAAFRSGSAAVDTLFEEAERAAKIIPFPGSRPPGR